MEQNQAVTTQPFKERQAPQGTPLYYHPPTVPGGQPTFTTADGTPVMIEMSRPPHPGTCPACHRGRIVERVDTCALLCLGDVACCCPDAIKKFVCDACGREFDSLQPNSQ